MGILGENNSAVVCVPDRGANVGNNGPPPENKEGYRGVGLVEIIWKVCAVVVNCILKRGVELYNALHKFSEERVMGEDTLEAKLAQYLVRFSHEHIFQVFLDVRKAYDSLGRVQCLEILRGYGISPNLDILLTHYWEQQRNVLKVGGPLVGMA